MNGRGQVMPLVRPVSQFEEGLRRLEEEERAELGEDEEEDSDGATFDDNPREYERSVSVARDAGRKNSRERRRRANSKKDDDPFDKRKEERSQSRKS